MQDAGEGRGFGEGYGEEFGGDGMRKGWEYKSFETCINKLPKAKQVKTSEYSSGTKYPIISQEDKLISGYYDDESYVFHIDSPVVIFGDHTRVLKYIDFDFVVGADGVKIISPQKDLNAKFLLYYLQWYKIPNLGYSRHYKLLREIKIPLPPQSTQLAIVSELDKINELIRLKKEQLKDFDNLAQSLFYEMFGDPAENEKGWEVKKLGDISSIGTGSTPNRKNKDFYKNGTYPWVKSTEVCNLPIYSVEEYITEEALKNSNCTLYPPNTILMAMYGQGKTRGQIGLLKIEACTNQAVAAIMPTKEVVDEIFLSQHLMLMYEHIRNMARGGNQANLNLSIVKSIQIFLPPLSLQRLFAQRIEQIEREKSEVQKSIQDLETLLASRMQYWFE
ncbi:restriction endonuclease subunit S [Segatella copri]|uniref:Restriction endonuclease subunit S n=1 Tax=Segatella copri TaxID=165179 RepID=A0AAW5UDT2_9BACT|nr:restriction endonuclease subunit S [Segatella copri]MCW4142594.1 restriction endonuclease subunit S [Segatella copri]MCW4167181.1 restriction endonuclease subunit S [Segatella copri]